MRVLNFGSIPNRSASMCSCIISRGGANACKVLVVSLFCRKDGFSFLPFKWIFEKLGSKLYKADDRNRHLFFSPLSTKWGLCSHLESKIAQLTDLMLAIRIHLFHHWTAEEWLLRYQSVINSNLSSVTWACLLQLIFRIIVLKSFFKHWIR